MLSFALAGDIGLAAAFWWACILKDKFSASLERREGHDATSEHFFAPSLDLDPTSLGSVCLPAPVDCYKVP
jgi:hypothetical protein